MGLKHGICGNMIKDFYQEGQKEHRNSAKTIKLNLLRLMGKLLSSKRDSCWNAKVGCQEIPGVTGKLRLRGQNEAGQRLTVLPREHTGHSKHPLPTTQEMTTHEHHRMVNTKIRLILFFAGKHGEALYSQQKQD